MSQSQIREEKVEFGRKIKYILYTKNVTSSDSNIWKMYEIGKNKNFTLLFSILIFVDKKEEQCALKLLMANFE